MPTEAGRNYVCSGRKEEERAAKSKGKWVRYYVYVFRDEGGGTSYTTWFLANGSNL